MRSLERQDANLLILFLLLLSFPLLFALRALDDNTLTSWRWIFAHVSAVRVFLLIVPAAALAFVLSGVRYPERQEPVILFVLAWAVVVPLWSVPEVIIDSARYFLQAKHLAREGAVAFIQDWGGTLGAWTDLPLVPFLFGLLFRVLGEHRVGIQLFTTLLFTLAVVETARVGRRLWDREMGVLAGLLLLAMPYLLVQVPLMLVDVPVLFLFTLSLSTFVGALTEGGPARTGGAAAAIACAALAKYSAWPMLLVLPLVTAVLARKGNAFAVRRSAVVFTGAAVLAVAALLPLRDVVRDQLAMLHAYQWPALGRWKEGALSTFLFQVHPFVTVLACVGSLRALRSRDLLFLIPFWFVVFLLSLQVERIRYLLPLFPLLALMAAYGLRTLFKEAGTRRFAALSAVAASFVLLFAAYLPYLDRTTMANLRDAGAYLDTLPGDAVMVEVLPQHRSTGNTEMALPVLDLFTKKRLVYMPRPLTRPDEGTIRTAPLRFTWELPLPAYYAGPSGPPPATRVIIADQPAAALHTLGPRTSGTVTAFSADTGSFRYRTSVTVAH